MRTRPTHVGSSIRLDSTQWLGAALAVASLVGVQPATAATEVSTPERIATTGMDIAIVRPLAAARAGIGAMLFVPAAFLASPACFVNLYKGESCRPVYEAPYDVLIGDPVDYAFRRKMGDL